MLKDNLARKMSEQGEGFRCSVLARKTGLTHDTVLQILKGTTKNPGIYTMAKLADALGCSLDELVGREEFLENFSQKEKQFIEYDTKILREVCEHVINFIDQGNIENRNGNDVLHAITEIYEYSLKDSSGSMNKRFAEWFCSNQIPSK